MSAPKPETTLRIAIENAIEAIDNTPNQYIGALNWVLDRVENEDAAAIINGDRDEDIKLALRSGKLPLVAWLLSDKNIAQRAESGFYDDALFSAIRDGDIATFKLVFSSKNSELISRLRAKTNSGFFDDALFSAMKTANAETLKFLLDDERVVWVIGEARIRYDDINLTFASASLETISVLLSSKAIQNVIIFGNYDIGIGQLIERGNADIIRLLFADEKIIHRLKQGTFDEAICKIIAGKNPELLEIIAENSETREQIRHQLADEEPNPYKTTLFHMLMSGNSVIVDLALNSPALEQLVSNLTNRIIKAADKPEILSQLRGSEAIAKMVELGLLKQEALDILAPKTRLVATPENGAEPAAASETTREGGHG